MKSWREKHSKGTFFREYTTENNREVNLIPLQAPRLEEKVYREAHRHLVIPCHDVFIGYEGGILLVERDNFPVKGVLWPIGGRISRGIPTEDSLKIIAKKEYGLDLEKIEFLGAGRTYFQTEPFSHGHGTDTLNMVFSAEGRGALKLDDTSKSSKIIYANGYSALRPSLHPYVQNFMDMLLGE